MKKNILYVAVLPSLIFNLTSSLALANRAADPTMPLNHCYHWINERTNGYLTFKYNHANKNGGELTFYSTYGNGAAAGPGLYCAKTPFGSYTYGDRVIRIDFVDDVVVSDGSRTMCGHNGRFYSSAAECQSKPMDVHLYSGEWYVIKNPQAVKSWSANSDQLIQDLNLSKLDSPATSTHMDVTIATMQSEAARMGKKTFFNSQARLGLEMILKDPAQKSKIPLLSLIDMAAAYQGNKISAKEKSDLYVEQFDKALKDTVLSFEDFGTLLKNHPFLKDVLVSRIQKVNYSELNKYNTSTLIAALDAFGISTSGNQVEQLWQATFSNAGTFESLLATDLKAGGEFRKKFDASLPSAAPLVQMVKAHNLIPMLQLLDKYANPRSNLKAYTSEFFSKILKTMTSINFSPLFDGLKNSALNKEAALADLFAVSAKNKFANMDPVGAGVLLEKVRNEFSSSEIKNMEADLSALPLKVDNKLTYQLLEDFQYGKAPVPKFYQPVDMVTKLVERSIAEKSLGANTTNTFRMILSGLFHYFNKTVRDAKDDTAKAAAMQQASDAFLSLADFLLKKKQTGYSYIALQNGLFFANNMEVRFHPVELALTWIGQGDKQRDNLLVDAIKTSLDPSVLTYLMETENRVRTREGQEAKKLLDEILDYAASAEFKALLDDDDYKAAQAERKTWANVVKNRRVFSDVCHFFETYDEVKDKLLPNRRVSVLALDANKALARKEFCSKKP